MCLAVSAKILELEGDCALAEFKDGMKKKIKACLVENVKIGDSVIVHAGYAIDKTSEK